MGGNLGLLLDSQGGNLRVSNVAANQLAANAGLQANDRILSVNGTRVSTSQQLLGQLRANLPSDGVAQLQISRDGRVQTVRLDVMGFRTGLQFANPLAKQPGLVRLGGVNSGSIAANVGLAAGDELLSINGQRVTSVGDARLRLRSALSSFDDITLEVSRGGMLQTVRLPWGSGAVKSSISNASGTVASLHGQLNTLARSQDGQVPRDIGQIRSQVDRLGKGLDRLSMDNVDIELSEARATLRSIGDQLRWLRIDRSQRQELGQLQSILDHLGSQLEAIGNLSQTETLDNFTGAAADR